MPPLHASRVDTQLRRFQDAIFSSFLCFFCFFFEKLTKSGTPGWFLNKTGYFFFATGRAYAKRLQIAFWRLNPLRLVYAQHPKPFFRRSNPQNSAKDGPQKVLSTDNPILFRKTPCISRPVLRFNKLPDFVHTAPVFVHLQDPRRHGNGHLPAT